MDNTGLMTNWLLGMLLSKVEVPSKFQDQAQVIETMLKDDQSGMIDSLTDFAVQSANVNFSIESDNEELDKIFKNWLETINSAYKGKIPSGINPLAKEYFIERWKGASFPVLKIAKWENVKGILLPTKMYFVDGGSINAFDKDKKDDTLGLLSYDYYLGSEEDPKRKLDDNTIFARPYGRWFDKYPTPYLIKRGVYHNYLLLQSLKKHQSKILDQIIPYLMSIKKGGAFSNGQMQTYSNDQLQEVIGQFQDLMDEIKTSNFGDKAVKSPIRATNFDEEFEQHIPKISDMFKAELFQTIEKHMLSGLGFIDVADSVSSSRRESILNPKAFVGEIKNGVTDFKQVMKELLLLIKEKNSDHIKYMNSELFITASPVSAFMTDKFKTAIRGLFDRGKMSAQTTIELVGEVDFETEVYRREKERKQGIEKTMYPQLTRNDEDKGIDLPGKETPTKDEDKNDNEIPEDKKGKEAEDYDQASVELEGAPYQRIIDLPKSVTDNMTKDLQSVFMRVFNKAYEQYENDSKAFKISWHIVKDIGRKNKKGIWQRKKKRTNGKLIPVKLSKSILENALDNVEKDIIEEAMTELKIENEQKKGKLLDKLLKNKG